MPTCLKLLGSRRFPPPHGHLSPTGVPPTETFSPFLLRAFLTVTSAPDLFARTRPYAPYLPAFVELDAVLGEVGEAECLV